MILRGEKAKNWMRTQTKHFKSDNDINAMTCRCGCDRIIIHTDLFRKLDKLRKKIGSIRINSGFRCEKHNSEVRGVANSSHIRGLAVDFDMSLKDKDDVLKEVRKHFKRIGIGGNFTHVDVDVSKPEAEWTYEKKPESVA